MLFFIYVDLIVAVGEVEAEVCALIVFKLLSFWRGTLIISLISLITMLFIFVIHTIFSHLEAHERIGLDHSLSRIPMSNIQMSL